MTYTHPYPKPQQPLHDPDFFPQTPSLHPDPSLSHGYHLYYEREVPIELRTADGHDIPSEVGALEAIRVKVIVSGDGSQLESLRVELSSEGNLFFHYAHEMDQQVFSQVQDAQKLMVEFVEYPAVLAKMLNACIKEPQSHLAVLVMMSDGEAHLDFIQNMEHKFVELLSCRFVASKEDVVRQHITFRYNAIKQRLAQMQARLADISAVVKVKNPGLLLSLQKPARVSSKQPFIS
eukprot:TRINITY_DN3333_c0_g1_i1.p1 TRINITY_DN3333_c0_g1~~TRINITY_DN3333_c0_g1_i1.p1  ORF type:complete len:234 (+),score=32.84 TRINITY_DN3333_c0_g1_i1:79-780(+)